MANQWSSLQQAIFDFIERGRGSAVVTAVAGSGKTTTIVEAANRIPVSSYAAFVAFNKTIAEELKQRLPKHVRAMTLNAMGFTNWMRHINSRNIVVDANKTRNILDQMIPLEHKVIYVQTVTKLVALAKSVGIVPKVLPVEWRTAVGLTWDEPEAWLKLIDHYDINLHEDADIQQVLTYAREALRRSIISSKELIDFDDQLYMPVIMRARFWGNHFLFVDEAQDVNKIQRAMLKRALMPGGRLIAVGDPYQAIYGFRGADSDAIDNIKKEFGAIELPLSISYRCPKAVVQEAHQYVSHIQSAETAPEGKVETLATFDAKSFSPSDMVVCRNTAPLISLAYKLIRKATPCRVLGREIGQGLVALVDKMRCKTVDALLTKLAAYQDNETAKFMAKGEEQKAEALADKVDTIRVFIEMLPEVRTGRTIAALKERIESLFSDATNDRSILTLCTIHKAKGLEAKTVFILERGLMPSKYARQAWQQQQEVNIQYVAVTRAKETLYYIELDNFERKVN